MYDRMRDEIAWLRLQDLAREAENRRIVAQTPIHRERLNLMGKRIWRGVGLRFGWLPEQRPTFSDVA